MKHMTVTDQRSFAAVFFDLDGTLLDTLTDIGSAMNRVLEHMNFPSHPLGDYRFLVGDGARMLVTRALPTRFRPMTDLIDECLKQYIQEYQKLEPPQARLYDGIADLLDRLVHDGFKLAVISNKKQQLVDDCLRRWLSPWPFAAALGQRDDVAIKPDPTATVEIAARMGVDPSRCLFVGDTGVDMKTAGAAGMIGVGALWGFRTARELRQNGAHALIAHPKELIDWLERDSESG
jgi:phosphoglycolate phosphatase